MGNFVSEAARAKGTFQEEETEAERERIMSELRNYSRNPRSSKRVREVIKGEFFLPKALGFHSTGRGLL